MRYWLTLALLSVLIGCNSPTASDITTTDTLVDSLANSESENEIGFKPKYLVTTTEGNEVCFKHIDSTLQKEHYALKWEINWNTHINHELLINDDQTRTLFLEFDVTDGNQLKQRLIDGDLTSGEAKVLTDFGGLYIEAWQADFQQNELFIIESRNNSLLRYSLVDSTTDTLFVFPTRPHFSIIEFTAEAVKITSKETNRTIRRSIDRASKNVLEENVIFTAPELNQQSQFASFDDAYFEVLPNENNNSILYLYDAEGSKSIDLNCAFTNEGSYKQEGQFHKAKWLGGNILIHQGSEFVVYNQNLEEVKVIPLSSFYSDIAFSCSEFAIWRATDSTVLFYLLDKDLTVHQVDEKKLGRVLAGFTTFN